MKETLLKNKYILFLSTVLIALIIFLTAVRFYNIDLPGLSKVRTADVESSTEEIHGIEVETEVSTGDLYTMEVKRPLFEQNEKVYSTIDPWIDQNISNFLTEIAKKRDEVSLEKNDEEQEPLGHFTLNLDIQPIHDTLYTLIFTKENTLIDEEPANSVQTYTVDLDNDEILTLGNFVNFANNKNRRIGKEVTKLAKDNEELDVEQIEQSFANIDYLTWAIDEDNLKFYWEPIDSETEKVQTIDLPLEKIASCLTKETIEQFDLPEVEELDPNGKYVALTFDDGPNPDTTRQVLETLDQFNAKATFYMLGKNVINFPEVVQEVYDEGHEVASHSTNHVQLSKLSADKIAEELNYVSDAVEDIIGEPTKSIRPPYGDYSEQVIKEAERLDQPIIMWSVDSLDWKSRDPKKINQTIMSYVAPDAIILLHDIHQTTVDSLPELLKNLTNEGYEFATVSQLLELREEDGVGPFF